MASPGAANDGLVGPAGDGNADPGVSAHASHLAAERLVLNVRAMLAAWEEYDANRHLPVEQQRELVEPRIQAASLSALAARLRGMGDEHWAYVTLLAGHGPAVIE